MISIVDIKGVSKKGTRENNEDYIVYSSDSISPTQTRVIVLCDGMGGHGHGEVASKIVADSVFATLSNQSKVFSQDDLQHALDNALIALNNADHFQDDKKMGTTLVVVVINPGNVLVGHVGDSRCYLFDENSIRKFRTTDHSKVAEAVEAEILTEEEAINSQYKNILTRSIMSGKNDVKIDIHTLEVSDKDRLLLCTDGVVGALRDDELAKILVNRSVEEALSMIDYECKNKSHDNYSAIIVDLHKEQSCHPRCKQRPLPEPSPKRPVASSIEFYQVSESSNFKRQCNIGLRMQCVWCGIGGFLIALLLCGIAVFYYIDKIYKETNDGLKYRQEIDRMTDSLCMQKSSGDSLLLKKDLLRGYGLIKSKHASDAKHVDK